MPKAKQLQELRDLFIDFAQNVQHKHEFRAIPGGLVPDIRCRFCCIRNQEYYDNIKLKQESCDHVWELDSSYYYTVTNYTKNYTCHICGKKKTEYRPEYDDNIEIAPLPEYLENEDEETTEDTPF